MADALERLGDEDMVKEEDAPQQGPPPPRRPIGMPPRCDVMFLPCKSLWVQPAGYDAPAAVRKLL